ncbi:MAG TPA: TonB-dependent receptor [Xanthobacteraceae bacterium]|nr:TonB-dependent receptor [Xanthobacteraceae bacterium]
MSHRIALSAVTAAIALAAQTTRAQEVALPQVVVTAPSPIQQHALRRAADAGGNRAENAQAVPAESNPWLPSFVADTFNSMIVMKQNEIARIAGGTLGQLLFDRPGISATTFAPAGASRPVIRGLDGFRIRIQENGIGTHDVADLGEDHGVPVDPLAAQQVEVLPGPSTLRWGSQAIGGVVSVSNNRIPDHVPASGFSMETKGAVSSADRGYEASTLLDLGSLNAAGYGGAIHADIYKRYGGDYAIPNGRQANSGVNSQGESLGASAIGPQGYFGFNVAHFASVYHIPGEDSASNNTRIDMDQLKFTSKGEYRPDAAGIEAVRYWFGATKYKHNEINDDDGIAATFRNNEQEARIETQLTPRKTPFGALTTAFGLQFGHQNIATSGEAGGLLAPAETASAAAFVFNELQFTDTLKGLLAGRIEYAAVNGAPDIFPPDYLGTSPGYMAGTKAERDFAPKSVSLGLRKELPGDLVASLTGSYVERAPRAPELFSKGAHDAPGTFEIGNPDLKIEKAKTVEFSLRRPVGRFRFDGSLYYTKFDNFIYKRLTGVQCNEDFASCGNLTPGEEVFQQVIYSQAGATFYGGEFAAQYDVAQLGRGTWGVDAQYDYVHAQFDDGTYVPRIPPQRVGGGVYWSDPNWFARIGILHAFGHNDIAPFETTTGGYNLLKAEINYKRKIATYGGVPVVLTVGIVGDNLMNESVRNSVSFRKDDVELPGRNVRAYASFKF